MTPCRLVDTRYAAAGILVAGAARDFDSNGGNLSSQGGSASGGGVSGSDPVALAVTITEVAPTGGGNIRAWATTGAVPNASAVNYGLPGQGLNLANTTIVPLLQDVMNANEFTLRADVHDVHAVVDVVGYFDRADVGAPSGISSSNSGSIPGYIYSGVDITPTKTLTCFVTADLAWAPGAAPASGFGYVHTARRNVTAATDAADSGWSNYLGAVGDNRGTGSKSSIWILSAGTTYQFGCSSTGSGDFVGNTVFCTVTWLCR